MPRHHIYEDDSKHGNMRRKSVLDEKKNEGCINEYYRHVNKRP